MINSSQIQQFQEDGVTCLRGVFGEWIATLAHGVDRHIENPGTNALTHKSDSETGRFIEDFCNWDRIPEYREFVYNSPLGELGAQLMKSHSAQMFHDHLLYKEASSGVPTPWHQDIPYYCVNGRQTVSLWIPLEPRPKTLSLRCIVGSHLLPYEVRPTSWSSNESFYADDSEFMDIPDVDNGDFQIREWAIEPGDAIAFDFHTLHGARANSTNQVSRTLSFRLVGDDARYCHRSGRTSPNFPNIGQSNGERLREDWFPMIWPRTTS